MEEFNGIYLPLLKRACLNFSFDYDAKDICRLKKNISMIKERDILITYGFNFPCA